MFPLFTLVLGKYNFAHSRCVPAHHPGHRYGRPRGGAGYLDYLRGALALYLEARLDTEVMLGFFEHVLMLPFRFFQERTSGDLLMRLSSISVIREVLTGETVSAILDGAMAIFYLAVLLIWATCDWSAGPDVRLYSSAAAVGLDPPPV